jgi:peptidyl-prolyl cis-trans isomerase B (cyclophilin B)
MTSDAPHLDGAYAAFGKVTQGMDTADQIVASPKDSNDKPLHAIRIQSITVDTQGHQYTFQKL